MQTPSEPFDSTKIQSLFISREVLSAAKKLAICFEKFDLKTALELRLDVVEITFSNKSHSDLGKRLLFEIIARTDIKVLEAAIGEYKNNLEPELRTALDLLDFMHQKCPSEVIKTFFSYRGILEKAPEKIAILFSEIRRNAEDKLWDKVADGWLTFNGMATSLADLAPIISYLSDICKSVLQEKEVESICLSESLLIGPIFQNHCKIRVGLNWIIANRVVDLSMNIAERVVGSSELKLYDQHIELISLYDNLFNRCGPLHYQLTSKVGMPANALKLQHTLESMVIAQVEFLNIFPWPYKIATGIENYQRAFKDQIGIFAPIVDSHFDQLQARLNLETAQIHKEDGSEEILALLNHLRLEVTTGRAETKDGFDKIGSRIDTMGLGKFRQTEKPIDENEARRLFALIKELSDANTAKRKAPIIEVFRLYCVEGLTAKQIAKQCRCTKSLIVLRLGGIREKLGRDPAELRLMSSHFEKIEDSLSDSRAKQIHRESALENEEQSEQYGD